MGHAWITEDAIKGDTIIEWLKPTMEERKTQNLYLP